MALEMMSAKKVKNYFETVNIFIQTSIGHVFRCFYQQKITILLLKKLKIFNYFVVSNTHKLSNKLTAFKPRKVFRVFILFASVCCQGSQQIY